MRNTFLNEKIKYTALLPAQFVEDLKLLVSENVITSVNQGIRLALEEYIVEKRRDLYSKQMKEAARDKGFMERTLNTQEAFESIDLEEMEHGK